MFIGNRIQTDFNETKVFQKVLSPFKEGLTSEHMDIRANQNNLRRQNEVQLTK